MDTIVGLSPVFHFEFQLTLLEGFAEFSLFDMWFGNDSQDSAGMFLFGFVRREKKCNQAPLGPGSSCKRLGWVYGIPDSHPNGGTKKKTKKSSIHTLSREQDLLVAGCMDQIFLVAEIFHKIKKYKVILVFFSPFSYWFDLCLPISFVIFVVSPTIFYNFVGIIRCHIWSMLILRTSQLCMNMI